jgi:hypothetical protein
MSCRYNIKTHALTFSLRAIDLLLFFLSHESIWLTFHDNVHRRKPIEKTVVLKHVERLLCAFACVNLPVLYEIVMSCILYPMEYIDHLCSKRVLLVIDH